jgi:hypothetical protein
MRSRYRILGLCLVAVFAMSVVASATASAAAPEFLHCVAKTGGKFAAGCGKAGTGYEKEAVKAGVGKLKFTGKEGVSHLYGPHFTITCKEDTSKGEITGPTTIAALRVIFAKCEAENTSSKVKCTFHTVGKAPETIETNLLKASLGKVAKAEAVSEVGEQLVPEGNKGFWTGEGACLEVEKFQLSGAVIGEVKPINVMQTTSELIFEGNPADPTKQKIQRFEGGEKENLYWFYGFPMGFESKDVMTFEEPIQVT